MAEPLPKSRPLPTDERKVPSRPTLTLVRGEGKGPNRVARVVAATLIALVAGTVTAMLWVNGGATDDAALKTLQSLHGLYRRQGLGAYQLEKQKLKAQVTESLQTGEAEGEARNIAVYLFPELLADDDFEKQEAQALWWPLEQAIEEAPHSESSHRSFIELRADIWNYENADRGAPQLSATANQVIRIYESLSAPGSGSPNREQFTAPQKD